MAKPQKTLKDALNEAMIESNSKPEPTTLTAVKTTSARSKEPSGAPNQPSALPGRLNKKHVGAYFDMTTWQQWNILRIELDGRTTQDLMEEAVNDIFIKYGKSSIA